LLKFIQTTRPFFHVTRDDGIYPAHVFAATRFGSTKFKTNQVRLLAVFG